MKTDKIIIATTIIFLSFAIATTAAMTTPLAFAQASAPQNIEIIDSDSILDATIAALYNYELKDYVLYENGTAKYVFGGVGNNAKNMTIITTHTYTPEYGYTFNDSVIITPDGRQLIISTIS